MKAESGVEYTVGEPMPGTKWVVRGKLGHGGMGVVLDVEKGRVIRGAMKVIVPRFAAVPEFVARFLDEVRVTARLQHANIVQVLDFDRLADGTPFMVMERLRGRTLGAAMRETRKQGRPWTAGNTFAVASQVAEGLSRAHSNVPSIVHRDIKPENLYLHRSEGSFESTVKVTDFGVAALVGAQDAKLTGTPRYMAPEQVEGEPVSPQTDQYAFALVVYEMLTGRLPWEAVGAKALAKARLEEPPTPPARFCRWLPEEVNRALLRALARDPGKRHQTVHALMVELRGLELIADQTTGAGECHATVPTVGTLAEGPALPFGEQYTVERMSAPPLEGSSRQVFEAGSVMLTRHEGRPAAGAVTDDEATTRVAPARPPTIPVFEDLEPETAPPLLAASPETPMNGEAVPRDVRRGARNGLRRVAPAFVVAAAAAAALGGLGVVIFSQGSSAKVDPPLNTLAASAPSGLGAFEIPGTRQPSAEETVAQAAPPPTWLESVNASAVGRAVSAPRDGGATAARKAPSIAPRPTGRPPSATTRVPDDGRDELYVPGER